MPIFILQCRLLMKLCILFNFLSHFHRIWASKVVYFAKFLEKHHFGAHFRQTSYKLVSSGLLNNFYILRCCYFCTFLSLCKRKNLFTIPLDVISTKIIMNYAIFRKKLTKLPVLMIFMRNLQCLTNGRVFFITRFLKI